MNTQPRVYVDACGLQRPFDRVDHLPASEQAAVAAAFAADVAALGVVLKKGLMVASPMHYAENALCPDSVRKAFVEALLRVAPVQIALEPLTSPEEARLAALTQAGLKNADATHIVYAEGSADLFVTVDDRLIRRCEKVGTTIPVVNLQEATKEL